MTEYEDFTAASADHFNQWVDKNCALPSGKYSHEQLRRLLWLSWSAAVELILVSTVAALKDEGEDL